MAATKPPPILVADDDLNVLKALEYHLKGWGCRCVTASDKNQLFRAIGQELPAVLLLDVRFGEHDGVEVLRSLLDKTPGLVVIMMTAFGTIDSAVAAIKLGAYDYLTKPPDLNRLKVLVNDGIARSTQLAGMGTPLNGPGSGPGANTPALSSAAFPGNGPLTSGTSRNVSAEHGFGAGPAMIGDGPAMRRIRDLIVGVAPTEASVLILGESGTGKEVAARTLHARSHRRNHPFVALNMAALPRELVESTLFGHERGSFTGADQAQVGSVEAADGGTLFLDEIGEMDVNLQAKLLRFLQERTFQRVGSSKPKPVDVRILAATNQDPLEQVRSGRLRDDLYYRLNVVPLVMPPLRQRREDIVPLAAYFLDRITARYGRPSVVLSAEAADALTRYPWPGNVRQLENMMERLVIFNTGARIPLSAIPPEILAGASFTAAAATNRGGTPRLADSASTQPLPLGNPTLTVQGLRLPSLPAQAFPSGSELPGSTSTASSMSASASLPSNLSSLGTHDESSEDSPSSWTFTTESNAELPGTALSVSDPDEPSESLRPIDRIEKQAIEDALKVANGNVREAAKALGLGQATVYRKIKRYGIRLT